MEGGRIVDNKYLDINGLDYFKNKFERKILDGVAIISSSSGEEIEITDSAEAPLMGLKLYATCAQKTYEGKNLFNKDTITQNKYLKENDEGGVDLATLSGYWTTDFISVKANVAYKRSDTYMNGNFYFDSGKNYISKDLDINENITPPKGAAYVRFSASPYADKDTFMVNEGSELLPYEPYTGGIPSPSGDYPQEIQTISDFVVEVKNSMGATATPQTLDITIPEQGFYGIPVSSGGNYTDTSGQQWICDEFDFTSKKFIKRIGKKIWDGGGWWLEERNSGKIRFKILIDDAKTDSSICICNRAIKAEVRSTWDNKEYECSLSGAYFYVYKQFENTAELKEWMTTHPFEVLYPLETPVEYDLSDEEVQAYRSLQTYNDKTVITTNSNLPIWIKSNFILAIRPYVDNKFFELESKMNTVGVVHIINKNELSDNQAYRIAKFDLSKFVETDFGGNYSPDIYIDILSWRYGLFYLKIRPLWATSKKILLYTASFHMKEGDRSIYNNSNGSITPPFKIRKTNTSIELYYASDMLSDIDTIQILSYNIVPNKLITGYNPKDHIVVDWSLQKIDTTSIQLSDFNHYYLGYDTIFSSSDDPNSIINNGLVPHPTTSDVKKGYFLKADGSWGYQHPPIIECSSIENSENLILTSEGEEILEELLSTPCFNFVIKLHGLSTDTFTATSQFAIAKNDRYIKLYDAATSEAIVVLKGGSYVYVTIIKVSENIYHGMCIRHNYNVEN